MKELIINEIHKKWAEVGNYQTPEDIEIELDFYKKMLNIFQVGDSYYFIFNPPLGHLEHASNSITSVLGYSPEEFTSETLLDAIHPDDLPFFADFESTIVDFKKKLPLQKLMKYKSQYDYRIRKKNGDYLRILQQSITIQSDDSGAVLRNFVLHSDISHIKNDNKMKLSFIGLYGEPSFTNVLPIKQITGKKQVLTPREKQVLQLLARNYNSEKIAECLHVSITTVAFHRKNILRKTNTHNVLELVCLALEKGWL